MIRYIAVATIGTKTPDEIITIPEGLWEWVRKLQAPFILTPSDQDDRIRAFAPLIKFEGHSDLAVPLRIEEELVGFLVLRTRGEGKYTLEHVELLATVAEPFAIALANVLAHEEVIKYRDIPPLRQRKDDIPALTRHFVEQKSRELGIAVPPAIAPGALDRLMNYGWPGNVRELENLVERELIRHRGGQLRFDSLLPVESGGETQPMGEGKGGGHINLDEAMSLHIGKVLKLTKGKIHGPGGAAELLGINPNTLRGRMGKLGIMYGRVQKRKGH